MKLWCWSESGTTRRWLKTRGGTS